MLIHFLVRYANGANAKICFEKPAGAHPESEKTIAAAFLFADSDETTATALQRSTPDGNGYGDWVTRKDSAVAILAERDSRITKRLEPCAHCDGKGFWPAADASSVVTVFCSYCDTGVKAQAEHADALRTELDDSMAGLIGRMKRDGKWQELS